MFANCFNTISTHAYNHCDSNSSELFIVKATLQNESPKLKVATKVRNVEFIIWDQ